MTSSRSRNSRKTWRESLIALAIMVVIASTVIGLDLLASHRNLLLWMNRDPESRLRLARKAFLPSDYYRESEDKLFLEELPRADYSKGGVFLLGSSSVLPTTRNSELPVGEQALIHNYGFQGSNHSVQFRFLQFLNEQQQIFRAGGDKSLIVLGATYHSAHQIDDLKNFFHEVWKRHALFEYRDERAGIRPVLIDPLRRWTRIAMTRIPGFILAMKDLAIVTMKKPLKLDVTTVRKHNPVKYQRRLTSMVGPNWERNLPSQIHEFERLLDFLQGKRVRIVVVLFPLASWDRELPYPKSYNIEISRVCREKGVELRDWSQMLDDEDFGDSSHANLNGSDKLNHAFLEIALPFLRQSGALPESSSGPR